MTDTPTPVYGLRQQELGTNTNTWGDDKLNNVIVAIAQLIGQIKEITITGNYTITSTNYVPTADNKNAGWEFVGTLTSNATITVPSSPAVMYVVNGTTGGFSTIIKTAAGTGITVPNGYNALLWSDGVNVYNLAPQLFQGAITVAGQVKGVSTGTASTDATNVAQVAAAIAAASLPASAGTVLVGINDSTAGYISTKITGSGAVSVSTVGASGTDQTLNIAVGAGGFTDGGLQSASFAAAAGSAYNFPVGGTVTLPAATGSKSKIMLSPYGNGITTLSGTVNGLSTFPIDGNQTLIITDADPINGWV